MNFLIGPAGSGKTWRCLKEVREALLASPEGLPLVFLAPRQATFQLESALLAEAGLAGYTRLKILSFDKLGEMILDEYAAGKCKLLSEDGRVMVLRSLLAVHGEELRLFQSTARLPGFAQHLSEVLHELQHQRLTPGQMRKCAAELPAKAQLAAKLDDLALLLEVYLEWLEQHGLSDPSSLLQLAAERVQEPIRTGAFRLGGLWLDGFAQISPQELELLAGMVEGCDQATLAFCLDARAAPQPSDTWPSMWSTIYETVERCSGRLGSIPGVSISRTCLERRANEGRFAGNPALAHLEAHWSAPKPLAVKEGESSMRIFSCPNPEVEARVAAREICKFVQEGRGRYREVAILVRSLEGYGHVIRRVLNRYGIPFFVDQRQSISHHPLSELTRYALRVVLCGWEHEDWFGALKTGLVNEDAAAIDQLENAALARGWRGGSLWLNPLSIPDKPELERRLETLRQEVVPAFARLAERMQAAGRAPTGAQLAESLRELWKDLKVAETMESWSIAQRERPELLVPAESHATARRELERWLENVELAFAGTALTLAEWLPVIDAGLSSLSVGVVPPALDQVLVGAVDRSRNPDLQLTLVLGANEMVFPAVPRRPVLLTRTDRITLASAGLAPGPDQRQEMSFEQFLGYIACTRARQRVVLTFAQRNLHDESLNPSSFVNQIQRLFPGMKPQTVSLGVELAEAVHSNEMVAPFLRQSAGRAPERSGKGGGAAFESILERWEVLARGRGTTHLGKGLAGKLYGPKLMTSVSDLEEYAACPFKFFVRRGLKAEERQEFEVDPRERGSFLHEVMMEFHRHLQGRKLRWRDITPADARKLIGQLGTDVAVSFRQGLFQSTAERQFTSRQLIETLQNCIEVLVGWAPQYLFDPCAVEISFGAETDGLQPWSIPLGDGQTLCLRGRIDRVDVHDRGDGSADVVVIDYKSSGQQLEEVKLMHGLDLQLLAYLGVLRDNPAVEGAFKVKKLLPAGAFYVGLRAGGGSKKTRHEALEENEKARQKAYQHCGRFDGALLALFDNTGNEKGDQFRHSKDKRASNEALPEGEFAKLVTKIENFLKSYGREIYAGRAAIDPYRVKQETACDYCEYNPICRFDPWTDPFRVLRKP